MLFIMHYVLFSDLLWVGIDTHFWARYVDVYGHIFDRAIYNILQSIQYYFHVAIPWDAITYFHFCFV